MSWEGVDRDLFEVLRTCVRDLAGKRRSAAVHHFQRRHAARAGPRPAQHAGGDALVYGIGEAKLRDLGEPVLALITTHCRTHNLPADVAITRPAPEPPKPRAMTEVKAMAFTLFRLGTSVADVMHQTQRTRTTVLDYLCEYIRAEKPAAVHFWIEPSAYDAVAQAAREVGTDRLKPIFLKLGEKIDYDTIRVVIAHRTMNGVALVTVRPSSPTSPEGAAYGSPGQRPGFRRGHRQALKGRNRLHIQAISPFQG